MRLRDPLRSLILTPLEPSPMAQGNNVLHFYYDAQNRPAIVIFNGTAYGYLYNLQGDVVALVDGTGTKVVEYT